MSALPLLAALALATSAGAMELPTGVQAVPLQRGEVVLLEADGQPAKAPTQVPPGWYYTELGHHRLTVAVAQLQSDRAAAEAKVEALEYALAAQRANGAGEQPSTQRYVVAMVLLFALGTALGYGLRKFPGAVLPARAGD